MWTIEFEEWRTRKKHKFHCKHYTGIQWRVDGDYVRIEDYSTGKLLKQINISKFGACSINCYRV